jgi:hypothetical protein
MTAAHLFVREMLWRPATARQVPEPVIALLGPRGAGKTHTLRAISRECGGTIVHALLDFANPQGIDPFAAVAYVAFEMMRTWKNLPKDPTFHRVGLSLLALNEDLPDGRTAARAKIRKLIAEYTRGTREGRRAVRAAAGVDASVQFAMAVTGIGATPQGNTVNAAYALAKPAIADLLQTLARLLTLRGLERWFSGLLEDANLVDSLIALSRRRVDPLNHLMSALLADLAQNATQRSVLAQTCPCGRDHSHEHAWLLLVDNADNTSGQRFLTALVKARQQRAAVADQPELDPLLVVAAADQWEVAWGNWWQEPWEVGPESPARQRIPLLSKASVDQWASHAPRAADILGNQARAWYPVWLDPPDPDEITKLTPMPTAGWDAQAFGGFVRRLSGDLPAAMSEIRKQFEARPSTDGLDARARSLLFADDQDKALWQQVLRSNLPDMRGRALWRTVPEAVAVACHLIEPGRTADDLDPDTLPDAANIVWALRTNLWISRFAARPSRLRSVVHGDAEHHAVVHPWLVRCLLAGLFAETAAAERRMGAWAWDTLFAALSGMDSASSDAKLYYDLARDKFDEVVTRLVERFSSDSHREWVRLLDEVTAAPCRWPAVESTEETVNRLVPDEQPGRETLHATIANLVALLWLYRDPLTIPNEHWDMLIHDSFTSLRSNFTARGNRAALVEAAEQFEPPDGRSR